MVVVVVIVDITGFSAATELFLPSSKMQKSITTWLSIRFGFLLLINAVDDDDAVDIWGVIEVFGTKYKYCY